MLGAMAKRSLFLMLDIDNTLYEYNETGFGKEMHDHIFAYADMELHIPLAEAKALSEKYCHNYGLSLRGYVEHYGIDAKAYSDYVHRCSYDRLSYNAPLVDMLTRLHYGAVTAGAKGEHRDEKPVDLASHVHGNHAVQHHMYYFTNANRPHARHVLEPLGLKPLFTRPRQPGSAATEAHRGDDAEGFEDAVEWLGFSYEDQWRLTGERKSNKPMKPAYEAIFKAIEEEVAADEKMQADPNAFPASSPLRIDGGGRVAASPTQAYTQHKRATLQPRNMVMVDDTLMNLDAPLELGWSVVWYAHDNLQLPTGEARAAYTDAIASGRMKIIRHILELEKAVDEMAAMA